jgi:site-specific DNA-cytosine methylase
MLTPGPPPTNSQLVITDLYAGGGTFSSVSLGNNNSEYKISVAVDNAADPLKSFHVNFPDAVIHLKTLPCPLASIGLPMQLGHNEHGHYHFSPPCTSISSARRSASSEEVVDGLVGLAWAIEAGVFLSNTCHDRPATWTVENVSVRESNAVAAYYAKLWPHMVAYATLDSADFGVCQRRQRLFVGTPELIRRLVNQSVANPVCRSIKQAFADAGMSIPETATHIKCTGLRETTSKKRERETEEDDEEAPSHVQPSGRQPSIRSMSDLSHAIVASRPPAWCQANGVAVRMANVEECRCIMGLPAAFVLPKRKDAAIRVLGNGIAGGISKAIMRHALQIQRELAEPNGAPHSSSTPTSSPANDDAEMLERAKTVARQVYHQIQIPKTALKIQRSRRLEEKREIMAALGRGEQVV